MRRARGGEDGGGGYERGFKRRVSNNIMIVSSSAASRKFKTSRTSYYKHDVKRTSDYPDTGIESDSVCLFRSPKNQRMFRCPLDRENRDLAEWRHWFQDRTSALTGTLDAFCSPLPLFGDTLYI